MDMIAQPTVLPMLDARSLLGDELLSLLPLGCALIDSTGQCIYLNPTAQKLLGCQSFEFSKAEFYPLDFEQIALPNLASLQPYLPEQLPFLAALQGQTIHIPWIACRSQEQETLLSMQAVPRWEAQQQNCQAIVTFQDITHYRQAIAQITFAYHSSESQLQCLTETGFGASFCYFTRSDGSYGFSELDLEIVQIYGMERQVFLQDPDTIYHLAYPADRADLRRLVKTTRKQPQSFDLEYRIVTPQGQIKWTKVIAKHRPQPNGDHLWHGMVIDITERKQVEMILADYQQNLEREVQARTQALELEIQERKRAETFARNTELALRAANAELERLASLDGLTQIANRRRFDESLQQTWKMMIRDRRGMSVILCDVDYFKHYNDRYGHQAGDVCLQKVAQALQATVRRSGDLVARYGGEEFVIILANTDLPGATRVAQKIQAAIAELAIPHAASAVNAKVTLSFGVAAVVPSLRILPESLVVSADQALYQAKRNGRNQISWSEC